VFNGTFNTNGLDLYGAFDKYVAVKKVKLMRKLVMLRVGNLECKESFTINESSIWS